MDKLKEILFGLIVIAALGVIFLPMILTEKHDKKEKVVSAPAKPAEHKLAHEKLHKKHLEDLKEKEEVATSTPVVKQDLQDEPVAIAKPEPLPHEHHHHRAHDHHVHHKAHVEVPAPMPEPIVVSKADEVKAEQEEQEEQKEQKEHKHQESAKVEEKPKPVERSKHKVVSSAEKQKSTKHKNTPVTKGSTVQVGTFSVHENAINLVKKLKRAGYPAYTKNVSRAGRNLTVVFVGPYSNQNAAIESVISIQDRYGLKGEILHFSPSLSTLEEDEE